MRDSIAIAQAIKKKTRICSISKLRKPFGHLTIGQEMHSRAVV